MELVFRSRAVLTVEYCKSFLAPQLDQWRDLLDLLLKTCCSGDHTPDTPTSAAQRSEPPLQTYLSLYKGKPAILVYW